MDAEILFLMDAERKVKNQTCKGRLKPRCEFSCAYVMWVSEEISAFKKWNSCNARNWCNKQTNSTISQTTQSKFSEIEEYICARLEGRVSTLRTRGTMSLFLSGTLNSLLVTRETFSERTSQNFKPKIQQKKFNRSKSQAVWKSSCCLLLEASVLASQTLVSMR